MKRVVVTGTGVISALGCDCDSLWNNLLAGKSAVRTMPEWPDMPPGTLAAPVELDENVLKSVDRKLRRSMGQVAVYAALAAQQAVLQSGLSPELLGSGRAGCMISSTMGSARNLKESVEIWNSPDREMMPAMQFFKCVSHTAAMNVANLFGIRGMQLSPCSACASGLQAVGAAYDAIRAGRQDVVLAGGAEELSPMVTGSFELLFALSRTDSRPFDADRDGLVCGEGAGVLVLEEYEHAVRRNAPILFEVAGYATNCSGMSLSQSDGDSIEACIRLALADAGVDAVDYVNAHATATSQGDREEASALRNVFGGKVAVSSLKGNLGHTLGASGAIELAMAGRMMEMGLILPTRGLRVVAEDCGGLDHVMELREQRIDTFVKSSFAFGGVNAVLVGKRFIK